MTPSEVNGSSDEGGPAPLRLDQLRHMMPVPALQADQQPRSFRAESINPQRREAQESYVTTDPNRQGSIAPVADQAAMFPPLERETRSAVDTATAAHHLLRKPQTLRLWAMSGSGPIQPLRVHGRLAWPVADIRRLVGLAD